MKNTYSNFKRSVLMAYQSQAINPCVCFSESKGWFVESSVHPMDKDSCVRLDANYSEGERTISHVKSSWQRICRNFEINQYQ